MLLSDVALKFPSSSPPFACTFVGGGPVNAEELHAELARQDGVCARLGAACVKADVIPEVAAQVLWTLGRLSAVGSFPSAPSTEFRCPDKLPSQTVVEGTISIMVVEGKG